MGVWSVVFRVHLGVRLDCHLLHAHVLNLLCLVMRHATPLYEDFFFF